jgi:hypothetical protein
MEAGTVRLEPGSTKNRTGRLFLFGELVELREAIEAAHAEHQALKASGVLCPYVFQRNGKPIRIFRKAWINACKARAALAESRMTSVARPCGTWCARVCPTRLR